MTTRVERGDRISLLMLTMTSLLTAALYGELPARVPIQFDLHGNVNRWAHKELGAWVLPATMLGALLLLRLGDRLLPAGWRERMKASPTATVSALLVGLFSGLQLVILYVALRPGASAAAAIAMALSAFWIGFGQVLPRVQRNPLIGIRTTWTLTSDENWLRTHRVAAWVYTTAGIVGLFASMGGAVAFTIALLITSAVAPAVYSYLVARRLPPETR